MAEAARDDQYTRDLVPVLGDIRGQAVALGSEAARLAAVVRPTPVPVRDPEPLPIAPPRVVTSSPVSPPVGSAAARRRVVDAGQLDAALDELRLDVQRHPSARFELVWRPLEPDEQG